MNILTLTQADQIYQWTEKPDSCDFRTIPATGRTALGWNDRIGSDAL